MTRYQTLVEVGTASEHLRDPEWVFVDCRFTLGTPDAGWKQYLDGHIPGAVYADLERDLSGQVVPGRTGRHPLPTERHLESVIQRLGIDIRHQVVAYDQRSGGLAAARFWWLLHWAGLDNVAVLDGGLDAWISDGFPTETGDVRRPKSDFGVDARMHMVAEIPDVVDAMKHHTAELVDARAAGRFRGENETLDPVGGHIPGALSLPYEDNLQSDGRFRPLDELRLRFSLLEPRRQPPIMYCGSGVTAAHNALAHAHAGLGETRLFPGSWSEWITDPSRPIERD